MRLEAQSMARSRGYVVFTLLQALAFLALLSLFGLTGSQAPTGVIDDDHGPLAGALTAQLAYAHHSFRLIPLTHAEADRRLRDGTLVAAITIPSGFSTGIRSGRTIPIVVQVDNVDADLTDDIQRALPSAIVGFGTEAKFPGVRVVTAEHDLLPQDTFYIPYLAVSALALDGLVVGAILGGTAIAREFEGGTLKVWRRSPAPAWPLLAGKLAVTALVATVAMGLTTLAVELGYGIRPIHPWQAAGAVFATVIIFIALGAWLGSVVKRTLPLVPLIFGLAMPLYVDSGSLEPARFDGEIVWWIAHASPVYYAIGVLQSAFHDLRVTPESPELDLVILVAGAALATVAALRALHGVPAR
jgi:hypothetical protein